MTKERLLKLAKEGIVAQIERADSRARRFRNKAYEIEEGLIESHKTPSHYLELAEKWTAKKWELEKEYDEVESMLFGLDFE